MIKTGEAKAKLVGLSSSAQKALGNVSGTVTGTVNGLVQNVRSKYTTPSPQEDHEIMLKKEMDFHQAAKKNDVDTMTRLKEQRININAKNVRGREPFHLAAERGHINMINNLLGLGLFTSEGDKDGNTALHLAATNGHETVLRVLLEEWEDNDKDIPNQNGASSFYLAVEGGHEKCADLFLQDGCNINAATYDDYTALHIAAEKGYVSLVTFLLRNNIDLIPKPNEKNPPIHLAILKDHMDVVDVLLEGGYDINTVNARLQTPLHLAAELKNTDLVETLLTSGCKLSLKDKQEKTALGVAARSNHTLIVDMIIKAERYYTWKKGQIEDINFEDEVTFKQDHSSETAKVRSALWNLAYQQLKQDEWKKLAHLWGFTEPQIKAIETQWTDKASYKEHGNRMLLIWLHGALLKNENPIKSLFEDLVKIGHNKMAETFRVQSGSVIKKQAPKMQKKCVIS
ncbi:ankyrin repeat and death domain-containing protein 1B isoform X2 [Hyperolius riggenbachi]|uniref:ankyrin repeat and death domain-containing protein 1B isoform X2 n=1 Tax=Hyperolius riggenbachi TaxID=752182 RepID=UPI0035A30D33